MKSWIASLLLTFGAQIAFAQNGCGTFTPQGKVMNQVKTFDAMMASLPNKSKPIQVLEDYRKKYGLPLEIGMSTKTVKEFPDRLEFDDVSGAGAKVFIKEFKLPKKSKFSYDTVFEAKEIGVKKSIRKWSMGNNGSTKIVGISGDDLLVSYAFQSLCSGAGRKEVFLSIKPNGTFHVINPGIAQRVEEIDKDLCAAHRLMEHTEYAVCGKLLDAKTKKPRILVFQYPMT